LLSREDLLNDVDEARGFEKSTNNDITLPLNTKISANSVYQSKNMNLSRFISSNKSHIDFKNQFNRRSELRNIHEIMLLKGNRCTCTQSQINDTIEG